MTTRRAPEETVHDYQHRLIKERWEAYDALPKRGPLAHYHRREAFKTAHWTLLGHLRGQHGIRGGLNGRNLGLMTREELDSIHQARH